MILECPSCCTRYLVQIGLFAQGGRKVRCARCKHEWHVSLPSSMEVVAPLPDFAQVSEPTQSDSELGATPASAEGGDASVEKKMETPNLPALINDVPFPEKLQYVFAAILCVAMLFAFLIVERNRILSVFPSWGPMYASMGLSVPVEWEGLVFEDTKFELRYDGGTMKLFVDGVIYNATSRIKRVPPIHARALGVDGVTIQSWRVSPAASTIKAGGRLDFHTEISTPLERTIETVYLEFVSRKELHD